MPPEDELDELDEDELLEEELDEELELLDELAAPAPLLEEELDEELLEELELLLKAGVEAPPASLLPLLPPPPQAATVAQTMLIIRADFHPCRVVFILDSPVLFVDFL